MSQMKKAENHKDLQESDKAFWHGYLAFYEHHLPEDIDGIIIEFGVFKGASIRWLLHRFPSARIIGVDIVPQSPDWPIDPRVQYATVDQGRPEDVAQFFADVTTPFLIIEDGSHIPSHQSSCLREGMAALAPGGIYILEDIHTSHPAHKLYESECRAEMRWWERGLHCLKRRWCASDPITFKQTALSVLLGFDHLKRLDRESLDAEDLAWLAAGSHFNSSDILTLYRDIEEIHSYRRATLPSVCYRCKSTKFRYHSFKCECGTDLFLGPDSMSMILHKRL